MGRPDGIGLAPSSDGSAVDVFVNHEESTLRAHFQDASVSRVTLNTSTGAVMAASVVIPPEAGFHRFCSAFMAGPAEGFDNYTFFTGEEAITAPWTCS